MFYANRLAQEIRVAWSLPGALADNRSAASVSDKYQHLAKQGIAALAAPFGRRLVVATIGFGSPSEDFAVLKTMAEACKDYGCVGIFQDPVLTIESLSSAMVSLTVSLTQTMSELTQLGDPSVRRTVRDIQREARNAVDDTKFNNVHWIHYNASEVKRVVKLDCKALDYKLLKWTINWINQLKEEHTGTKGVAMKRVIFGEGAERQVRNMGRGIADLLSGVVRTLFLVAHEYILILLLLSSQLWEELISMAIPT